MTEDDRETLNDILNVLKLAFAKEIDSARREILSDKVSAAVLGELADDWVASGDLQRKVATASDVAERTIRDRLADLASKGAIRSRGQGRSLEYRRTDLI